MRGDDLRNARNTPKVTFARWVRACAGFVAVLGAAFLFNAPLTGADAAADARTSSGTAWEVYEILHTSCVECHGGHLTKPKGKLGYILDLERLVQEAYIIPGDAENSDLLRVLTTTDEEERMPPPDAESPAPTATQIETIRSWIASGARIREMITESPDDSGNGSASAARTAPPVGRVIGRFHPVVIHFPIALLMCACATELLARGWRRQANWLQSTTRGSLWLATLGAIFSGITGWLNAAHEGFASGEVDTHRWLGVATVAAAGLALAISEWTERRSALLDSRPRSAGRTLLLVVLLAATILVFLAGHTGGRLVWGEDYLTFF